MSYFVKTTSKKEGLYLQIYDSGKVPKHVGNVSTCIKSLGYLDDLISDDMPDPLAYWKAWCHEKNLEARDQKRAEKTKRVGNEDRLFDAGALIIRSVMRAMGMDQLFRVTDVPGFSDSVRSFSHYAIFEDYVCARVLRPASKCATFDSILPTMLGRGDYSLSDVYACLDDLARDI